MKRRKWKDLIVQALSMFFLALIGALTRPVNAVYIFVKWMLLPCLGFWTSMRNVRSGINPYVAWVIAPVMVAVAGFLVSMGYSPDAGGVFFCALISLIGAAAGDVLKREKKDASQRKLKGK